MLNKLLNVLSSNTTLNTLYLPLFENYTYNDNFQITLLENLKQNTTLTELKIGKYNF